MRRTALALLVGLTAACSGGAAEEPAPTSTAAASTVAAVPGIEAEAVQLRTDAAIGGQVHVRITASDTFTVTSLALDSPGFAPLPAGEVTAGFTPGRVIDLPAPYGDPICSADPLPVAARLTVARPGEAPEEVAVPLTADDLARIHAAECAVLALGEVIDIGVTGLHDDGDALAGELVLTRRSGEDPVRALRLGRSVLVDVEVPGLPLELTGDRTATAISFTPASCDPHVLSETKQPYRFALLVEAGDEQVAMDLPLGDADRRRLDGLVKRVCAERE
jgi:hypothetical protein